MGWYAERLERIHDEDRPRFSLFDRDAACEERRYNTRLIDEVFAELEGSARRCVAALNQSAKTGWPGMAVGSDGTARSAPSQALRAAHEVVHHIHDISEVTQRAQNAGRRGG